MTKEERVLRAHRVLQKQEDDEMPLDKWHWDWIRTELDALRGKWKGQATIFLDICFVAVGGVITVIFVLFALRDESDPETLEVVVPWVALGVFAATALICALAHRSKTKDAQNEVSKICEYMEKVEQKYEHREHRRDDAGDNAAASATPASQSGQRTSRPPRQASP